VSRKKRAWQEVLLKIIEGKKKIDSSAIMIARVMIIIQGKDRSNLITKLTNLTRIVKTGCADIKVCNLTIDT